MLILNGLGQEAIATLSLEPSSVQIAVGQSVEFRVFLHEPGKAPFDVTPGSHFAVLGGGADLKKKAIPRTADEVWIVKGLKRGTTPLQASFDWRDSIGTQYLLKASASIVINGKAEGSKVPLIVGASLAGLLLVGGTIWALRR